jgi:hypothetical protein
VFSREETAGKSILEEVMAEMFFLCRNGILKAIFLDPTTLTGDIFLSCHDLSRNVHLIP